MTVPAGVRAAVRTPAAAATADTALIERAVEIDVLGRAVARATEQAGGVVCIEAPAGLGKTALLDHTARIAEDAGCLVRRAAPGPLERHFPFGVVRALLEAPVREAPPGERERLLAGVAGRAGDLLVDGAVPEVDATTTLAHSLLWLCSTLAERRPLALVIDDGHWADRPSLEVLTFMARRVADVPLLIVVAARGEDPDAASDLLALLGDGPATTVLRPAPLTTGGGVRLVRRMAPDTPVDVCRDCHTAAHGNPWLLAELARQVAAGGSAGVDPGAPSAPPVSDMARRVVRRRLAELTPAHRSVAEALSVLGASSEPEFVAAVSGVPLSELAEARDALLTAGLLGPGGDKFAHALVAAAVAEELSGSERERLHREAARALLARGGNPDRAAGHLLRTRPQADPDVSALLAGAAFDAVRRGAPHAAAAYLERALDERADGDDRGLLIARLSTVAFDAGLPDARERLRDALREVRDPDHHVEVVTRLVMAAVIDAGKAGDAGLVELLDSARAAESDPDVLTAIDAAALDALILVPDRQAERARRAAAADPGATTDPLLKRVLLAHRAWLLAEVGGPDAAACAALASQALEGGALLAEAGARPGYHLCVRALLLTDHVAEAQPAIEALRAEAIACGSLPMRACTEWYAAHLALRTGRIAEAENAARLVLDLMDGEANIVTGGATEILVLALAERGATDEARDVLRERGLDGELGARVWEIGVLGARARLALAEGDFERALAEARKVWVLRDAQGRPNPTMGSWRSTAALALAHLGRRDEAIELADADIAAAELFGAPSPLAVALHARAVAESDEDLRPALCERALAVADGSPAALEAARVRLELGSALRRTGRRVEARAALQRALADADGLGAVRIADHARRELVATGLRPRRAQIDGPAALTPRQRQVCALAAGSSSNRDIAQQLFLSVKTVETHLAASYRKLGVDTRAALAAALAPDR